MASYKLGRLDILTLYKTMLRESQKFSSYNYRNYALRRIRDAFKENRNLTDKDKVIEQVNKAHKNLAMIKRQAIVGNLYQSEKLIIEQQSKKLP